MGRLIFPDSQSRNIGKFLFRWARGVSDKGGNGEMMLLKEYPWWVGGGEGGDGTYRAKYIIFGLDETSFREWLRAVISGAITLSRGLR